jgi:hypothetical protein
MTPPMPEIAIVILQRGWVVIGRYHTDGIFAWITRGGVVRRWGTSAGLGQLAAEGPSKHTILDPLPLTHWHVLTQIAVIECNTEVWTKHYGPEEEQS